ncbi:CDP-alcohol phosphatidyltransferase family protein [Enterovirga sp.]|uniref:CDP-alcohol phosphatidyltransferase family protein n=1 Tax=Enterovirga sp. TaxID=2026350 RepID=UPI002C6289A9|nr:CDP-alcohol phosphatidyltransferase family protein [Enterovirga sp.]HMO28214.1 CDP-alcohol phosphatidyltransferase family protein [Enterovirga sp.]
MAESDRRPIAARGAGWTRYLLRLLLATPITPNQISLLSIAFAALGAWALALAPHRPLLYVAAAACIQLRLVCNLMDGLVAVEGGRASTLGALYNEFPDRVADSLLIVAAGYAAGTPWLGWAGALAAALTAYVRVSGGALGLAQDFRGPMAKQHRMAVLTLACLLACLEQWALGSGIAILLASWAVFLGSLVTCGTRTLAIARQLEARP